jgi:hypothetical protein
MDNQLLTKILDEARYAASPADAMRIQDLQTELDLIGDEDVAEVMSKAEAYDKIKTHVETQPFDVEDDEDGKSVIVDEISPNAFSLWLGELETLVEK